MNAPTGRVEREATRPDECVVRSFDIAGSSSAGSTTVARAMRLSTLATLEQPYAQSPVVYSCIRVNADSFASIPRRVWLSSSEDAEEAGPGDPLVKLLDRPNPLMGPKKLQRAISVALDMAGGVFFLLVDEDRNPIEPGEIPAELWPVRDDLVQVEKFQGGVPSLWSLQSGKERLFFPDHAVAHIYWPNPHDPFKGFGPTQAAWRAADHLYRAEAFDDGLVSHGGQIGGIFTHDERRMTEEQRETLQKAIDQNAGRSQNNMKKLVLPAGLKFTPTSFSPVDMQAEHMRKMKREEVARIYGVPPVMLGELEDANRSSLRELRRVYYENTIAPRAEFVEEEIAYQLMPKLPPQFAGYVIEFDYRATSAMREDMDAQIERVERLVHIGRPYEEACITVGFECEPGDGADERWIGTDLQTVENASAPPPEPVLPEPQPDEQKSYQERRSMAARFDASLKKHDDAIGRAVNRVFRDYLNAQRKKLRDATGGTLSVHPWHEVPQDGKWSRSRRAYAELMEMVPSREVIEGVRGISEAELESLLVGEDAKWGAELWAAVEKPIKAAMLDHAKEVARAMAKPAITAQNPRVLRHMAAKRVQIVEGPMSVVAARLRNVIVKAMADTSGLGTLADRVRAVLEELKDQLVIMQKSLGTRSMMIARTESASAANAGRVAQFRASGIVQHEWVTAGDDLVRETHQIDGEVTIVGERFSNGLSTPGEAGADAEQVINCRCTTAPVIQDGTGLIEQLE